MGSLNQVQLIGNLGRDAELRYTQSGVAVATFSMATTEKWNDKGGQKQEKTEWHKVVIWAKLAEAVTEYLTKGKQVYVQGKLETRTWEKDGVKRYSTEIRAFSVILLGGGRRDGDAPHPAEVADPEPQGGGGAAEPPADDDSEIPFSWLVPFAGMVLAGSILWS